VEERVVICKFFFFFIFVGEIPCLFVFVVDFFLCSSELHFVCLFFVLSLRKENPCGEKCGRRGSDTCPFFVPKKRKKKTHIRARYVAVDAFFIVSLLFF